MGDDAASLQEPFGKLRHRNVRLLLHRSDEEGQMIRQRPLARRTTGLVRPRLPVLGGTRRPTNRRTGAHSKTLCRPTTRLAFSNRTRNSDPQILRMSHDPPPKTVNHKTRFMGIP